MNTEKTSLESESQPSSLGVVRRSFINPFYKGGTVWKSYRIIDKGKWHISWNSLFHYHDFSLTTPKPLYWFIRYVNDKDYFIIQLFGFTYIVYKNYA